MVGFKKQNECLTNICTKNYDDNKTKNPVHPLRNSRSVF